MQQRFIKRLSPETLHLLQRIYRSSEHYQVRQRAHCMLLSFKGFKITELMSIFGVTRKTIYTWLDSWEEQRLVGLYDRPGRGRKATFSDEEKAQIRDWAKANPKNLNAVLAKLKGTWKVSVSKSTLKRILKSFSMRWRRLRRVLAGKPDPVDYEAKQQQLEEFQCQEAQGDLDLRYMDES